jgi:hypothetical protein
MYRYMAINDDKQEITKIHKYTLDADNLQVREIIDTNPFGDDHVRGRSYEQSETVQ